MQNPQLRDQKHKKILLYFQELTRHKIELDECLKFLRYVFSLSEVRITYIIKNHELNDYNHVKLEHFDLDLITINSFAKKLTLNAIKEQRITQQKNNNIKPYKQESNNQISIFE